MVKYIWDFDSEDKEKYAEYDPIGGAIIVYLVEIKKDIEAYKLFDHSGIYQEVVAQVLVHEDIHQAIADAGIDTLGEQEHEIMEWVKNHLDSIN